MLPNIDTLRDITEANAKERERKLKIEVDKYIDKTVVPLLMDTAAEGKYVVFFNMSHTEKDFIALLTSTLQEAGYSISGCTYGDFHSQLIIEWR